MKKLSIITICYNEPFLEKTCESIVNQTWQDFEWIVVDGGSNKETLDKFEKYKNRIDKFVSEPDNGIYDACNKGINLATGEYVIFMNAGDSFYSPEVLNNIFTNHDYNSGVLYGDTVMIDNKSKQSKQKHCAKIPHEISKNYFYTSNICTQSMFVKKELYFKYGLHNLKYKILGDLDRNLAFISNGEKFEYIPVVVSYYDRNGVSSVLKTFNERCEEQKEIIKTYFDSDEISFYDNLINFKYQNIFERLFSIKKQFSCGKFYNTVTICGIKIKIKNQAIPMMNSSKNKNCAIVIPCYKENMTEDEEASLIQCAKVLNKYDICLIAPNELNLEAYLSILNKYSNKVLIKRFSDDYFKSVNAYNRLMLNIDFYKSFSNYNFMLIYQLDAWVFRDELEYWCEQGYDYLGAPWFEEYEFCNENSKFLKYCGNGGFSLRNIAKICNLLSKKHCVVKKLSTIYRENRDKNFILNILKYPIVVLCWIFQKERFIPVWKTSNTNEDGLITNTARKIYPDFKVATAEEAIPFAFECNPDVLYEMNDKQLPFGCHAYKKYNWDFWKEFINVREVLSER